MRLTDIPLDRPVATLMLLLSLTVLGTVAVFLLPLDFMPVVNEPEIDIEIPFPGAHPLETLREVVEPIEAEIATIPGRDGNLGLGQLRICAAGSDVRLGCRYRHQKDGGARGC